MLANLAHSDNVRYLETANCQSIVQRVIHSEETSTPGLDAGVFTENHTDFVGCDIST